MIERAVPNAKRPGYRHHFITGTRQGQSNWRAQRQSQVQTQWINTLRDQADIVDNRRLFLQ